jgi:hypothetical protein
MCQLVKWIGILTEIHDVVSADGAVVDNNVPRPKSDSIPLRDDISTAKCSAIRLQSTHLLHLKSLLRLLSLYIAARVTLLLGDRRRSRRIRHVDIGHGGGG